MSSRESVALKKLCCVALLAAGVVAMLGYDVPPGYGFETVYLVDSRIERPHLELKNGEVVLRRISVSLDSADGTGCKFGEQFRRYDNWNSKEASAARKCAVSLRGLSSDSCRLFALCEPTSQSCDPWPSHSDRRLLVFDLKIREAKDPDAIDAKRWEGVWKRTRSVPIEVVGPFETVAGTEGDYLIVRDRGIYFADWTKSESPVRPVRIRDGELVQAIVRDLEVTGATFAFTSKYWFRVAEPLEYHEFELGSLKADDPMPTLVRCAREVRRVFPSKAAAKTD